MDGLRRKQHFLGILYIKSKAPFPLFLPCNLPKTPAAGLYRAAAILAAPMTPGGEPSLTPSSLVKSCECAVGCVNNKFGGAGDELSKDDAAVIVDGGMFLGL